MKIIFLCMLTVAATASEDAFESVDDRPKVLEKKRVLAQQIVEAIDAREYKVAYDLCSAASESAREIHDENLRESIRDYFSEYFTLVSDLHGYDHARSELREGLKLRISMIKDGKARVAGDDRWYSPADVIGGFEIGRIEADKVVFNVYYMRKAWEVSVPLAEGMP